MITNNFKKMKEIGFKGVRKSGMVFRVNVKPGSYHHFPSVQEALFNHLGKASMRCFYYKYTVTVKSKTDLLNSILFLPYGGQVFSVASLRATDIVALLGRKQ